MTRQRLVVEGRRLPVGVGQGAGKVNFYRVVLFTMDRWNGNIRTHTQNTTRTNVCVVVDDGRS